MSAPATSDVTALRRLRRLSGARLGSIGSLALLLLACASGEAPTPPGRIVLVTIDTLRADHVGAYGYARARTPVLDGLAARGVLFEAAVSPAPLTLPSHTTLLTGLDPPRHGVRHNSLFRLDDDVPTLAGLLRARGFETAAFVGAAVLARGFGLARGFSHYDDELGDERSGVVGYAERRADAVVDAALAWLERAPDRFFLWVHFYDPHAAYDPPPGFALGFAGSPYDGEIAFADFQLGRLLEAVRARHPGGDTLVVVASDHGESLGEHGEPSHSYTLYDATQRVPLVVAGPGVAGGRRVEEVVGLVDVAPTLLHLAGASAPEALDGRSLWPLLRAGAPGELAPRPAYVETLATHYDFGWSALRGLRSERFKYVSAPEPELYDLRADPAERENLAAARPERTAELAARLRERLDAPGRTAPAVALDPEERARLESLGYVVPDAAAREDADLGGPDPKSRIALLSAMAEADVALTRGDAARALALLEPFPDEAPQLSTLRAAAALAGRRPELAERDARAALALSPGRADAWTILGRALAAQGRPAQARDAFEAAVAIDGALEAGLGLGRAHEQLGEREAAARTYAELASERPGAAEPVWHLAALRIEDGEEAEAARLLASLDEAELRTPPAALRLARAEREAGKAEAALSRLTAAIEQGTDSPLLHSLRAVLLEEAGRPEEALAEREAVLSLAPGSPVARNDLAWSLARLGRDLDRALALAEGAVGDGGRLPAFLDTLAEVRLRRGEPEPALAAVDEALGAPELPAPARARLLFLRASALLGLGRREAAARELRASFAAWRPEGRARPEPWHAERTRLARELGVGRAGG